MSNVEVWNRCAQSLLKRTESIHSMFNVGRWMFDVHGFLFLYQTGRTAASGWLTPDT